MFSPKYQIDAAANSISDYSVEYTYGEEDSASSSSVMSKYKNISKTQLENFYKTYQLNKDYYNERTEKATMKINRSIKSHY